MGIMVVHQLALPFSASDDDIMMIIVFPLNCLPFASLIKKRTMRKKLNSNFEQNLLQNENVFFISENALNE